MKNSGVTGPDSSIRAESLGSLETKIGNREVRTCYEEDFTEKIPVEGLEPTHSYLYQILSLARLPIPPHRLGRENVLKIRNFGKKKGKILVMATQLQRCMPPSNPSGPFSSMR